MKLLNKKINRYLLPILIILVFIILPIIIYEFSFLTTSLGLFGILTFWILSLIMYLIFILTIGRLIKSDFIAITLNIGIAFVCIGYLFRIMHWPGAKIHLISGLFLFSLAVFFMLVKKNTNR